MSAEADTVDHELHWISDNGQVKRLKVILSSTQGIELSHPAISELITRFPKQKLFFELWAGTPPGVVTQLMRAIETSDSTIDPRSLTKMIVELISVGSANTLNFLQQNLDSIQHCLTPQYRDLIRALSFAIPKNRELIFNGAEPDLYLYRHGELPSKDLLVCFCTKSNSLNAPLPIAHIVLQRLATDILYVRNRPGINPADGLAGLSFDATCGVLNKLIRDELGYERITGLGTSIGGYAACVYAEALDFAGVLNFSGAPGLNAQNRENLRPLGERIRRYPHKKILSVLSMHDETDKKILKRYQETGFKTQLTMVDSPTHGSFTAAVLERKIALLINQAIWGNNSKTNQTSSGASSPGTVKTMSASLLILPYKIELPGFLNGIKQPSVAFSIQLKNIFLSQDWKTKPYIADALMTLNGLTSEENDKKLPINNDFILEFVNAISSLLKSAAHPILCDGKVLSTEIISDTSTKIKIQVPCLQSEGVLVAANICADFISKACDNLEDYKLAKANLRAFYRPGFEQLNKGSLLGFNTLHFLKAANELGIPWQHLSGQTFQYGYGSLSRLLNSSFSDKTSTISAAIARDKTQTARLLKLGGIPTPSQLTVNSAEDAVKAAERLSYPVVVKPADQDGGLGVSAFLTNSTDVSKAYEEAKKYSTNVIIEKFIEGNDYRIQIVDGAVQGIIMRSPAGVIGNGSQTILELISKINHERKKATDDSRFLHQIAIDAECMRMLSAQNLNLESIPKQSVFVRLRGAANVSSGGTPKLLNVQDAHEDNIELALKAARLVRLDVAGVDLLIPDIKKSWRKVNAAICEVNAQPQMFTTFHRPMLKSLIGGTNGRIPIVTILRIADIDSDLACIPRKICSPHVSNMSFISNTNRFLSASDRAAEGVPISDWFSETKSALVDTATISILLDLTTDASLAKGIPFLYCDLLVISLNSKDYPTDTAVHKNNQFFRTFLNSCDCEEIVLLTQETASTSLGEIPDYLESINVKRITKMVNARLAAERIISKLSGTEKNNK